MRKKEKLKEEEENVVKMVKLVTFRKIPKICKKSGIRYEM